MSTLYERRGRRYVATHEYDQRVMGAMPEGAHLVVVEPGLRSTRYNVKPDAAPVLAALRMARDKVVAAVVEAAASRPQSRPLSKQEQVAIAAYYKIAGPNARLTLEVPSASEVVDAMERELLRIVEEQA